MGVCGNNWSILPAPVRVVNIGVKMRSNDLKAMDEREKRREAMKIMTKITLAIIHKWRKLDNSLTDKELVTK